MENHERSWLTEAEISLLKLCAAETENDVFEVGTFRGGTVDMFAKYRQGKDAVWSLDSYHDSNLKHHRDYDPVIIYNEYLAKYPNVFLIVGDSRLIARYWARPLGLLFLDGGHDYETASADFWGFSIYVGCDGYVILHDYGSEKGVTQLVDEVVETGKWRITKKVDTIVVLRRVMS